MIISARRPYVTFALVALQLLIFLAAHGELEQERAQFAEIQSHTLFLAANHPNIPAMTAAQGRLTTSFRRGQPQVWEDLSSSDRAPANAWEKEARSWDADRSEQELRGLGVQLDEFERSAVSARFSLYPPHLTAASYVTSSFLHRSWAHLIFNLLFLLLAGAALEEVWGWQLYLGFYFVAGAAAVWSYAIVYPDTAIPLMGASGVLAGIMGALLVRFPKTRMMRGSAVWRVRPDCYGSARRFTSCFPFGFWQCWLVAAS